LLQTVALELSSACGFACVYCDRKHWSAQGVVRETQHLEPRLVERILDEVTGMSPRPSLTLSFEGESALHPQFPELLALAGARGLRPWLSTSLKGAGDDGLAAMLAHCGTVCVSLEIDREAFAQRRGTVKDYGVVLKSMERLLAVGGRAEGYAAVAVSAVVPADEAIDSKRVSDFCATWIDRVDEIYLWNEWDFGEGIRLARSEGLARHLRRRRRCLQPEGFLAVLSDGTVSPCCLTSRVRLQGVTARDGILAVLEAPAYQAFLARHAAMELEGLPCQACDGWLEGWLGDETRTLQIGHSEAKIFREGCTERIPGRRA